MLPDNQHTMNKTHNLWFISSERKEQKSVMNLDNFKLRHMLSGKPSGCYFDRRNQSSLGLGIQEMISFELKSEEQVGVGKGGSVGKKSILGRGNIASY